MTLRNYVENLREEVDRLNRVREIERQAEAAAKLAESIRLIKRSKPLDEQISELMRSLPPALRDRPWQMAELVQQLNGRYRDRPHAKQVGDALRRLGWTRIRLWSNGADGQRVWVRQSSCEVFNEHQHINNFTLAKRGIPTDATQGSA